MANAENTDPLNDWIDQQMLAAPDANPAMLFRRYADEHVLTEAEWMALLIVASEIVISRPASGETVCG